VEDGFVWRKRILGSREVAVVADSCRAVIMDIIAQMFYSVKSRVVAWFGRQVTEADNRSAKAPS
jgi:hypothetical protein